MFKIRPVIRRPAKASLVQREVGPQDPEGLSGRANHMRRIHQEGQNNPSVCSAASSPCTGEPLVVFRRLEEGSKPEPPLCKGRWVRRTRRDCQDEQIICVVSIKKGKQPLSLLRSQRPLHRGAFGGVPQVRLIQGGLLSPSGPAHKKSRPKAASVCQKSPAKAGLFLWNCFSTDMRRGKTP